MLRTAALQLTRMSWFRKFMMSTPVIRGVVGRFVGGEDLASGLAAVRQLNAKGIKGSLNFHGMHALDRPEALEAADQAIMALQKIDEEGLDANVSVKLTKLGLDVDATFCREQLQRVLACASEAGGFVRIDMEESAYVEPTIRLFEEMQDQFGGGTVGLVLQSYLRQRSADLDRLLDRGASIRLVKGGYRESAEVVFRGKAEVDAAFLRDIERLLGRGRAPAIATHDHAAIAWALAVQSRLGLGREDLEFQMLYGVKEALQERLVAEGHRVRCYVPYGGDWVNHVIGCLRRLPADFFRRFEFQRSRP